MICFVLYFFILYGIILLSNTMLLIHFCMRRLFVCWPLCADVVAMPPHARKWWRVRCRCNIPAVRGFPAGVTSSRGRSHAPLILPPSPYYHCDGDWASSISSPDEKHKWGKLLYWHGLVVNFSMPRTLKYNENISPCKESPS